MSKNKYIVNSGVSLKDFVEKVYDLYGSGTYLEFTWKGRKKSTMPQKALVHIWFRTFIAHTLNKPEKDVIESEIEWFKTSCKRQFYLETQADWMTAVINDPFHPEKQRREVTSIADWEPWQCAEFMTWLQAKAAQSGLMLESMGEYRDNFSMGDNQQKGDSDNENAGSFRG